MSDSKSGGKSGGSNGLKKFKDMVEHDSWMNHAYAEATVWDPRYICGSDNNPEFSGDETDQMMTLETFFSRNDTNP